jgi:hypothetical protein
MKTTSMLSQLLRGGNSAEAISLPEAFNLSTWGKDRALNHARRNLSFELLLLSSFRRVMLSLERLDQTSPMTTSPIQQ